MKFIKGEVEEGFYGFFQYPTGSQGSIRSVIFRVTEKGVNCSQAIYTQDGEWTDYNPDFSAGHNDGDFNQRPATAEETAWLDACIKEGKLVERPEVYEIY